MKRHPVQFKQTLWEAINMAALKEGKKRKRVISPSEYVRGIVSKHIETNPN